MELVRLPIEQNQTKKEPEEWRRDGLKELHAYAERVGQFTVICLEGVVKGAFADTYDGASRLGQGILGNTAFFVEPVPTKLTQSIESGGD